MNPRRRLIYTSEAALLARVQKATIRDWVRNEWLVPAGRGRNGQHLFIEYDVLVAERRARRGRMRPRAS